MDEKLPDFKESDASRGANSVAVIQAIDVVAEWLCRLGHVDSLARDLNTERFKISKFAN